MGVGGWICINKRNNHGIPNEVRILNTLFNKPKNPAFSSDWIMKYIALFQNTVEKMEDTEKCQNIPPSRWTTVLDLIRRKKNVQQFMLNEFWICQRIWNQGNWLWECRLPSPCPIAEQTLRTSASTPPRRSPTPCRSGWGRESCAHSWCCGKERCQGNIPRDVHRWGSIRPLSLRTLCLQQCLCLLVEAGVNFDQQCVEDPFAWTILLKIDNRPVDVEVPPVAEAVPPVAVTTTVMLFPDPAIVSNMVDWRLRLQSITIEISWYQSD